MKEYNREIFNKAKNHLLTQNAKSVIADKFLNCAYRGDNGYSCPVGHFIKDEHYSIDLEKKPIEALEVQEALRKSGVQFMTGTLDILKHFQMLHDFSDVDDWKNGIDNLEQANKCYLS